MFRSLRLYVALAASALAVLASPVMAQNQFPDPNLLDPGGMSFFGSPAVKLDLPTMVFTSAGTGAVYTTTNTTNADLLAAWPVSEARFVSVNVVSYTAGDVQCRFRGGTYTALGIAGTGPSSAVSITAGTSGAGLQCRGFSATLSIRAAGGVPAFNITT